MGNRYNKRRILSNDNELYENLLDKRDVNYIRQYGTPSRKALTLKQITSLTKTRHIWVTGDRFYKLSMRYYGSIQYWWVIAQFNQKPTDSHVSPGDLIYVPLPLQDILRYYGG
jgi:hypothetical protein